MFYSQTYLARKGPLGTVWCAAHLQHRLKKSHYMSTDLTSTISCILYPEVPIALRMSGHLLLGVVRIYSKKVEYLFQDYNILLNSLCKAFASIDLTLPEGASKAPFHSITLPERFDLDAFDLDIYHEGGENDHLRNPEDITLTDQVPNEGNFYVTVSFEEDLQGMPDSGVSPNNQAQQQDVGLRMGTGTEELTSTGIISPEGLPPREIMREADHDASRGNLSPMVPHGANTAEPQTLGEQITKEHKSFSEDLPPREIMREADHDASRGNLSPMVPHRDNTAELQTLEDQTTKERETFPSGIDNSVFRGESPPLQPCSVPITSAGSPEAPAVFDSHLSFDHPSPNLVVQPSPPIQQPRLRRKRKNRFFDERTVLTNEVMRNALNDASDLKRMRRHLPSSTLGVWKLKMKARKEEVLFQPLLNGLSAEFCNTSNKDYICSKSHLFISEQHIGEPTVAPPPAAEDLQQQQTSTVPGTMPEDMEVERIRDAEHDSSNPVPEFLHSPSRLTSPLSREERSSSQLDSVSTVRHTIGLIATPDLAASSAPGGSELAKAMCFGEDQTYVENSGLSDIPEFMSSAEDLQFLDNDHGSSAGSQGSDGIETVRTRAVAQYLQRHTPSPNSEGLSGDLSMNKILEGKTRKLCARMFFEVLVLKSHGYVDVQQEEPYGDISLKLTPTLSKAQI